AVVKPQIAFFEQLGARGMVALERVIAAARARELLVLLDAKRGDIGSTAEHYAREAFDRYGAHAVTVNPYLGTDSVEPFFAHGGGVIALCRTSNPGGDDVQSLVADGRPVYMHVADLVVSRWSQLGDCGLVVGATYPTELAEVRSVAPDLPILVPGVGAQGGDPATVVEHGAGPDRRGLIVNSSRAVLYASDGDDFAEAARAEAARTAAALRC
ncbi:MAG: orotidine-5'-phosphate decarboxylase, partial [Acidimicrobiia bacterium]|nr:orotidine-5'-phosphate decarboxylase [Acidimicrobiia bacterium]